MNAIQQGNFLGFDSFDAALRRVGESPVKTEEVILEEQNDRLRAALRQGWGSRDADAMDLDESTQESYASDMDEDNAFDAADYNQEQILKDYAPAVPGPSAPSDNSEDQDEDEEGQTGRGDEEDDGEDDNDPARADVEADNDETEEEDLEPETGKSVSRNVSCLGVDHCSEVSGASGIAGDERGGSKALRLKRDASAASINTRPTKRGAGHP